MSQLAHVLGFTLEEVIITTSLCHRLTNAALARCTHAKQQLMTEMRPANDLLLQGLLDALGQVSVMRCVGRRWAWSKRKKALTFFPFKKKSRYYRCNA
jgi:hypothetical protein